MICVYPAACTDFSGNGLGVVRPQSCTVTETLNGEWELTLVHPIDEYGKWTRLSEGNILRAPVPAAMTPRIRISVPGEDTRRDVYQVDTDTPEASVRGGTLRLRTGPGEGYSVLKQYANGTEVQVLSRTNAQWYEVVLPDGKRGYMSTTFLRYVRTEGSVSEAVNAVVDARQLRDQPFRIYRVVPELGKLTVYARHIFYDLLDNMVKSLRPSPSAVGASVVQGLASACLSGHGFTFYSDLTSTAQDVSLENVNPVEALLGEGGLAEKYGGELTRDWFDVFLVRRVGADSDVQIREGKNLTGISYDVDETDVVTRIMPTGEDADGNLLYLPELYIDSPNIGAYTHPKWIHLAVSEAKEVTDGDTPKSKDQCYAELRKAAQTEYENGCDLPTVTLKVDFVNCADTEEYRQYGFLQNIFLGDSVRVVARRIGVAVSLRMTQYTYDCLTQKYTAVTLGTSADTLEGSMISARQLANGSITGMKLALNSVGSGQLQSGSVGSLQIKNAAVSGAHIQDACITRAHIAEALIDTLSVNALAAVTAKIKELAAGSVTTDDLYASVAMIAAAQLTTANIVSADIRWADIEALSARIAQISKAQITAAAIDEANIDWAAITTLTAATAEIVKVQMRTADIDWSHIKDLATDTAVITQGTAGELYIARLAVTEANMVSLTVGELVVKGSDGHFYSVSVDESGQVVTTLKQIANDDVADQSIDGGEKIIEGTITAGTLNVQDIFAGNAVIQSLIAANLDVDTLFAREATVAALNAMDITSNTYLKLMVSGKADKEDLDALNERVSAAELKLTEDAIVAAVTGSDQYKEDLAAIAATGSGPEFVVGTQTSYTAAWTGNAGFAALHDGQQITYWLPVTSGSNVTLNLTLADGSATGAIPCYYGGTTRLGTQYAAGNVVRLTYRENVVIGSASIPKGWWADANYNTDTYDRIRIGTTLKAKTAIPAGRLAVADEDGCFPLAAGVSFDVTRPVLYCAAAVSAGTYGSQFYLTYPYCTLRTVDPDFAGTIGTTCYVAGTLAGTVFTPAEAFLTASVPTEDDGLTYMALGTLTTAYQTCLFPEHPLYRFVDGAFKPLSQVAYEASVAIGETRREMSTRFEQTDTAIALKADQTEVHALSTRVQSAEQKITPQAITAAVAASASFVHEKYEGRNYCLGSGGEFTFISNRYYEDGKATSLTLKSLAVSDDFFAHSQSGASIRISLDIRRQGVEASEAATPGVYSGLWVYYLYSENGQFKTVGRGWYLRTTDASFQATDDGWVRLQYGPLDLSPYNPVSISYFALGTSAANGMTGNVRFRNVKLEVLDAWTDWSAAPEDIYGLAGRMDSAESRITQNAGNIALKVSTSVYNTEKVYRSNTAPATLYANMLWLDTSLSPPILKRYTGSAWVAVGAQELKTSGITIGGNNVAITTENFLLQLLDPANNENVLMEMSASGDVGFQALYADEVVSPSVVNAYTGPATLYVYPALSGMAANACRSLREALSRINGKALRYDVTVTFFTSAAETLYEMEGVEISGVTGPHTLRIEGMDRNKTLSTFLTVSSCTARIELSYLNIRDCRGLVGGTSKNSYLINARNNTFLSLTGCVLDLNNVTANAVQATASYVDLRYCEIRSAYIGLGLESATGNLYYCKGQCTFSVFCMSGIAFCTGTVPSGGRTSSCNGQIFDAGVTTDAGTSVAPQTPDDTTLQYATLTKSYRGGWRTDTVDVVQGAYSEAGYSAGLSWNYGCMWFGGLRGALSGKTVKSATLTLYRKTGSGSSSAKTLYLCAITNTTASGAPSIAANYGAIGTIGRAQQATFAIPLAAVQGLANGTYGGLCLYESPYNFGSANWSNCYMRMAGTDNTYKPYLQVVYNSGGTAAG